MKEYAITNKETKEFYPDPIYTDVKKGMDKIRYLEDYRIKNNMEFKKYELEELTKERKESHEKEWARFCKMID
jgi:hypothetical protein